MYRSHRLIGGFLAGFSSIGIYGKINGWFDEKIEPPLEGSVLLSYYSRNENIKPPGREHIYTNILVVGGGIVGSSIAYQLGKDLKKLPVEQGEEKIVLIDRGFVGSEATGLSAGTISDCGVGGDLFQKIRHESSLVIQHLEKTGYDCEYIQSGALQIAETDEQVEYLKNKFSQNQNGLDIEFLDSPEKVQAIEPNLNCRAAIHTPQSGHVGPSATAHAFIDAAKAHDVHVLIREGCACVGIEKLPEKVRGNYRVKTKNGMKIDCQVLITCPGAWAQDIGDLIGLKIPISAVKGQIWVTEEVPKTVLSKIIFITESDMDFSNPDIFSGLQHVPKFVTHDENNKRFIRHAYGRRLPDGRVIFGGSRIPCTSLSDHEQLYGIVENDISENQKHVYEFLPKLKEYNVDGAWAGPMPFSFDGIPIVGELTSFGFPNLWFIGGLGPHGIMEAPGLTSLLSKEITGLSNSQKELTNEMLKCFSPKNRIFKK